MKKFLSVIAIFLVLAMTSLSFSSCANIFISEAALAAISERILEGVNKISSAKALDADIKANIELSFSNFSFLSVVLPFDIRAQFNVSDANNPSAYFSLSTALDTASLTPLLGDNINNIFSNPNINASLYYLDGTMYSESEVMNERIKVKTPVGIEDFSKLTAINLNNIPNLVFFDETMIKSASLRNGADGSLTAKVTVESEKALRSMLSVFLGLYSSESSVDISSVTDEELSNLITETGIKIGDARISLTIDKDNNVTNFKAEAMASMNAPGNSISINANLSFDANFNPVGDDFRVQTPEDIESFADSGSLGKNDDTDDDDRLIFIPEADGTYSKKDVIYSRNGLFILKRDGFIIAVKIDNSTSDQSSHKYMMFPESNRSYYLNSDGSPKQTLYDALGIAPDDFINTAP
ncbi:MAG: hypothetical protein SPG74_03810 [Eubacteriales bacterium]|nr:hypothetical protein [Eubacteriales bacterium]